MVEPVHTAVILAAGMGTRLKQMGTMIPKGFLRFGGRPIVEESILKLRSHGVNRIVIVTGHLHFFYEGLRSRYPELITTVRNPTYETSGSMYSLWCARELIHEDFLLLESDIVYEDRAISTLLDLPEEETVLLSDETDSSDPVYVETENDLLVAMSKDRNRLGPEIAGELVGVSKISSRLLATMTELVERALPDAISWHYEEHGLVHAARRTPVHCKVVPGLLYSEIDDERDIAVTRAHILPNIAERDRQHRAAKR
jgi:2-aminoethylphosphonate-pyruvate transaminase